MDIITSLDKLHNYEVPCVVAMGTFDGLHVGHMQVINTAKEEAGCFGLKLAVFTFSNHPLSSIAPDKAPPALLTERQKASLLAKLGVDVLIDVPFNKELADVEPMDFLRLLKAVGYRCLVVGDNFTYGRLGSGNKESLRLAAKAMGFNLRVLPLAAMDGVTISSTVIRRFILSGDMAKAAKMLGRWYSLSGVVSQGQERGRLLGFPTANVELAGLNVAIPRQGVYAARVNVGGKAYRGMANIGSNPTFGDVPKARLETNIFGFDRNIYGQEITVEFVNFIREEMTFPSAGSLRRQLLEDRELCRAELLRSRT